MGGLEGAERGGSGEKSEQTVNQLKAKTARKLAQCKTGGSNSSGYWETLTTEATASLFSFPWVGLSWRKGQGLSVHSPVDCALWIPSASPGVSHQSSFLSRCLSQQPFVFSPGLQLQACSPHVQGTKHLQPTRSCWSGEKELLPLSKIDDNANSDLKTVPSLRS